MTKIIRVAATILISLSFAHAEWIGEFPGLDKLIKEADAIFILRVDHTDGDFGGIELYSTHNCFIYQRRHEKEKSFLQKMIQGETGK